MNDQIQEREYYRVSEKVYRTFARFYDPVTRPLRGLRRRVAALSGLKEGMRALDLATGTGEQAQEFAKRGARVVGVDLSEQMLEIARRKRRLPNLEFQRADATALPFENAAFDLSCVSFALHEMPESIRRRVIAEMARVTRAGGTVLVVDYGKPVGRGARALQWLVRVYEAEAYVGFVRSDLRELLDESGIEVVREEPVLFGTCRITTGVRRGTI